MSFSELDWIAVLLRTITYASTIAVAGGVLAQVTLNMARVSHTLNRQIILGALTLFLCEPLRYVFFQLSIAQGDWALAFDPSMRWIAMDMPLGRASGIRLLGAMTVIIGFVWRPIAVVGALLIISSYLFEGHTLSHGNWLLLAAFLFTHLTLVHWWLGALLPLKAATALEPEDTAYTVSLIEDFGRKAMIGVVILLISGLMMLGELTTWTLSISSTYQQSFAIKLAAFTALLSIAAINKLIWTPLLTRQPAAGQRGLRTSIHIETATAVLVLLATSTATSFPPLEH